MIKPKRGHPVVCHPFTYHMWHGEFLSVRKCYLQRADIPYDASDIAYVWNTVGFVYNQESRNDRGEQHGLPQDMFNL